MAKVTPIIADVPVANPSIPSVIFAPLETAVTINTTTTKNTIKVKTLLLSPNTLNTFA
ncbi:hypothetical protein D3C87_1719100 [compost metagenome]